MLVPNKTGAQGRLQVEIEILESLAEQRRWPHQPAQVRKHRFLMGSGIRTSFQLDQPILGGKTDSLGQASKQ